MSKIRGDSRARGAAFLDLFMGRDTDEAEAAAELLGDAIEVYHQQHVKKT